MKLVIYYRKNLVHTGKPICLSNGKSEIYPDKIILEGVHGQVMFNSTKGIGRHLTQARRHGTTTPLEIEIFPDFNDVDDMKKVHEISLKASPEGISKAKAKAILERQRYRKEHPTVKRTRKELWE